MKCCTEKIDIFFVGENIPKLQMMWDNAEKVKLRKTKKTKQDMLVAPH